MQKTQGTRNSSFELLRIIAMFMILSFHLIHQNEFVLKSMSFPIKQFVLLLFSCMGTVGVVIFFGISAWFLCTQIQSGTGFVRSSFKRIWLLERTVLFYSLIIAAAFYLYDSTLVNRGLILFSFTPTLLGRWWYVTAYVVFLIFYPFITIGLRKMGQNMHGALCLCFIVGCGLLYGLTPFWVLDFIPYSFMGFIYIYVLIAYYRWYMPKFKAKTGWWMIAIGSITLISSILVLAVLYVHTGKQWFLERELYLDDPFKLPVVVIGLGILLVASRIQFVSKPINFIAKTTFGVYLIHQHPLFRNLLKQVSPVARVYERPFAIFYVISILITIFAICSVLDMLRIMLFRITIDRHKGAWFDKLTLWISNRPLWNRMVTYFTPHIDNSSNR